MDSAAEIAIGAVNVCGLLLEYINQLQEQHRDRVPQLLDTIDNLMPEGHGELPDAPAPKSPAQVLQFISGRLPD